jgi:hypothetical protein
VPCSKRHPDSLRTLPLPRILLAKQLEDSSLAIDFVSSFYPTTSDAPVRPHPTMVRLREIPRTATFAWSPGPTQPLIATGTKSGAVDADFSGDTQLELWELKLDDAEHGVELEPIATVNVESRYAANLLGETGHKTKNRAGSTTSHGVSPPSSTPAV